jgi:hypothetical protein
MDGAHPRTQRSQRKPNNNQTEKLRVLSLRLGALALSF